MTKSREITTVFGVKWSVPAVSDIIIALSIFTIILIITVLVLRYYYKLKKKRAHIYQLFLFRSKHLGLSNYQIKILKTIAASIRINDPSKLLQNPKLFESGIANFIQFLNNQEEIEESLSSIYKDIVIIYEKLYHSVPFRRPLNTIMDIEENQLFFFSSENSNIFLGKLINKKNSILSIKLFSNNKDLTVLYKHLQIDVYLWRNGDAEYSFKSYITDIYKGIVDINIPEYFVKGKEVRHSDVDVILECSIIEASESVEVEGVDNEVNDEKEDIDSIILKLNIDEAVVRSTKALNYHKDYYLNFILNSFRITVLSRILTKRKVQGDTIIYYTLRFIEMSDAAGEVLTKYMLEHY